MPKVYATDPGSRITLNIDGRLHRLSTKVGVSITPDVAEQLKREIAGDHGCALLPEPCEECRRGCAEHEEMRPGWNERNPDQAALPHFGHVCGDVAHIGHVGIPGRTDVRLEWEAVPAIAPSASNVAVSKPPKAAAAVAGEKE